MQNYSGATPARRGSTRTTGLIVAGAMGLVSAGVIGYFVMFGSSGRRNAGQLAQSNELPPEITTMPVGAGGKSGATVQGGRGLSAQFASKTDPTRMAGKITSVALDPLEGKRYFATKPESFVYMKDGRTVHIRSDSGRLYMPQGTAGQPDSGTLNGNVVIGVYDPRADGKEIRPGTDVAALTLTTGMLTFDLTVGELTIPERFVIHGETADFAGTGLTLQVNQTQERAEYLKIAKSEPLHLRPNAKKAGGNKVAKKAVVPPAATTTAVAANTPAQGNAGAATPAVEAKAALPETFYHTVLQSNVTVTRGGQKISSDVLDLWTHLIDNQLPDNAIASNEAPKSAAPAVKAKETGAPGAADGTAVAATPEKSGAGAAVVAAEKGDSKPHDSDNGEVVITWSGPLELRPVETRPKELAKDDVTARFTSPSTGKVEFSDAKSKAGGFAGAVEYGATSRNLALSGEGAGSVQLTSHDAGQALLSSLKINLGTGVTHIAGAGELRAKNGKEGGERNVRWNEQGDFEFVMANGDITGVLKSASMSGAVAASDGKGSLKGDFLSADFTRAGSSSVMKRLVVRDGVSAGDGKGGSINCSHLDVAFTPRKEKPEQSDPTAVTARGNVAASRGDSRLRTDLLDVTLVRDEKGETTVKDVLARDHVRFDRNDGVWATSQEMHADAIQQIVDLSGEGSAVGKDSTSVSARQIRLDGDQQTLTVFGAGVFEHEEIKQGKKTGGRATAKWTKEMVFSDKTGVLDCRGDIDAILIPDELSKRVLKSERLRLEMTPGDKSISLADQKGGQAIEGADRKVLRVTATGAELENENGAPASVESTRYQPRLAGQTGRLIAESLLIEGHQILADDTVGTVIVPGKGRLIVIDKRDDESKKEGTARASGDIGSKGTALFYWNGDFKLDRPAGTATMRRQVQLLHKALNGDVSRLESEELTAYFRELEKSNAAEGDVKAQLLRVVASGAVWAKNAGKEMIADRAEYDAVGRIIRAFASENNDVTLYDPAQTTPITAQELTWDLAKDRIEVNRPGTIVAPK